MQSNKNPDLWITDAKTGKLMKVFVNLTLVDGDDHQLESQHKVENSKILRISRCGANVLENIS